LEAADLRTGKRSIGNGRKERKGWKIERKGQIYIEKNALKKLETHQFPMLGHQKSIQLREEGGEAFCWTKALEIFGRMLEDNLKNVNGICGCGRLEFGGELTAIKNCKLWGEKEFIMNNYWTWLKIIMNNW
jgi:hypothetical protein